jgi:hypothetical protein
MVSDVTVEKIVSLVTVVTMWCQHIHAKRIMSNGIILVPTHDFHHPPCWFYGVYKTENDEF